MEAHSDADIALLVKLFSPASAADLVSVGMPKDIAEKSVWPILESSKNREEFKALDIKKLIKDGIISLDGAKKITCQVETKKSVKYIRIGQLNGDGKIEGVGRMFYVTNCKGTDPSDWELNHISEG